MKKLIFFITLFSTLVVNGQLTSVGLEAPTSLFIAPVENSPLTSNGTLKLKFLTTISANTFFAAPNGAAGTPDFRGIVAADLPIAGSGSSGIINTSAQILGSGDKTFVNRAFFPDGLENAPAISFTSNTNGSGFSYTNGTNDKALSLSINGSYGLEFLTGNDAFGATTYRQLNLTSGADFIDGINHLNINIVHLAYNNDQDGGISVSTFTNANGHTCTFAGRTANGTEAAPTQSLLNDRLAEFSGKGFYSDGAGGGDWDPSNRVVFGAYAAENHTTRAQGAFCAILTTAKGDNSNHISMIIDDKGNAGLTDQKFVTTSLPTNFGPAKSDRFFSIQTTNNSKDVGIFLQSKTADKGMNIWLDNSLSKTFLDNIENTDAAIVQIRMKAYSGATSPVITMTANAYGTNFGGGTPGSGEVFSVGTNKDFIVNSSGKISKYQTATISDGELLIGKTSGSTFEKATLTSGTGISVNNSAGAITINASSNYTATADKTVANTTTETTLLATGTGSLTISANTLVAGKTYLVKAYGYVSTDASAPNWTVKAKLGSTVIATTTGAAPASLSSRRVEIMTIFTCRTTGTLGTIAAQGSFGYNSNATNGFTREMLSTSTFTIDTTAPQTIDLMFTWSVANANNTITITNATIEAMN